MDTFSRVLLISVCLCGQAIGADVETTCTPGVWYTGDTTSITCSVSKTKFPSQCQTNFQNQVQFRRTPTGSGWAANCTISSATSCSSAPIPGSCGCVDSGTHFVYTYTFTAHGDYKGYWDCYVPCLSGITQQLDYSRSGCDDKQVMEKTCNITASKCNNEGTESCSISDDGEVECSCFFGYHSAVCESCKDIFDDYSCVLGHRAAGGAIGLAVVACLLILLVLLGLYRYRCRKKRDYAVDPKGKLTPGERKTLTPRVADTLREPLLSQAYEVEVDGESLVVSSMNGLLAEHGERMIKKVINDLNPGSYDDVEPTPGSAVETATPGVHSNKAYDGADGSQGNKKNGQGVTPL